MNLIGVAISTAAFPQMTERLSQGRPDLFKNELRTILRVIIWLALPTAAIAFFARGYLVNFLFNGGQPVVASLLGILVVAILFRSIYHISARSFYAQQDTKTPLYISFFTIGLNIALAIYFTMVLGAGIYGLAWAQSIVAAVEVFILFAIMSMRIRGLFDVQFARALFGMLLATVIMSVMTYISVKVFALTVNDNSIVTTLPKFVLIALISYATYLFVSSRVFKLDEAAIVTSRLRRLAFSQLAGRKTIR